MKEPVLKAGSALPNCQQHSHQHGWGNLIHNSRSPGRKTQVTGLSPHGRRLTSVQPPLAHGHQDRTSVILVSSTPLKSAPGFEWWSLPFQTPSFSLPKPLS